MFMEKPLLLWVKSAYSFSWGTDLPESLVEKAVRCGFGGVMMADTGGVYGQHRFAVAALEAGIKGVAGAEVNTIGGVMVVGALVSGGGQLCKLITSVHVPERVDPLVAFSDSSDLFCIVKDDLQGASVIEKGWLGLVYIPVLPGESDPDCPAGVLPIACFPSMYAGENSPLVHSMLRKADELLPLPHVRQSPLFLCEEHLPLCFSELWSAAPSAMKNNLRLSDLVCTLPVQSPYRSPVITDDDSARLKEILFPRLREVYGKSEAAEKRLIDELRELNGAGLCGYFLVFHRVITYCRANGILAIARGSAAGSLVSRLLGLSAICPIRYGLSFSRFFNRLRDDPPDIDLDIDGSRRDKVYQWFLKEWQPQPVEYHGTKPMCWQSSPGIPGTRSGNSFYRRRLWSRRSCFRVFLRT